MTAEELFKALAPHVAPMLYEYCQRDNVCILATRVVLDVCQYFGVEARELAVRVVLYNSQFRKHVDSGEAATFTKETYPQDGSHSVGVGFGVPVGEDGCWDGHLIAVSGDCFGDFSIRAAERRERNIHTGNAVVGVYKPGISMWTVENETGTWLEYEPIEDRQYLSSRDWKLRRGNRAIVGALIRLVRDSGLIETPRN